MILLPALVEELGTMLAELEENRLEVVLVPQRYRTNEGGMVRVALSRNAPWYREFCASYPSGRRRKNAAFDTRIKRRDTSRLVESLLAGKARSAYAAHVLAIARRRLQRPSAASRRIMSEKLWAGGIGR